MRRVNDVTISVITKSMLAQATAILTDRLAVSGAREALAFSTIAFAAIGASIARAPGPIGLLGAGLAFVALTIAAIDRRRFIIPNALTAAGFALGIAHAVAQEPDAVPHAIVMATIRGFAFATSLLVVRAVYARVRGREGLGLGDVKLAGVAGTWLDWWIMPLSIEIAALAALAIYLFQRFAFGRTLSATTRLPFGLFFAPAIWMCWFLEGPLSPFR
jgi:leader peptidase (prepilin peptidase)/N-methyltransferase